MSFVQRFQSLKEAAQISLDEIEGFNLISERVLTQVVLESIRSFQQKLSVGIEDSAADLLDTFKKNIIKQIFETASGWRVTQRDCFVLPRGCRFSFQRGSNTIVVVEQDPQVRTLSFRQEMQGKEVKSFSSFQSERVSLSIPYTIFVFTFANDRFTKFKCFFRSSPLKNIADNLHCSVLPNIHIGGDVCLGDKPSGTITEVCEKVIASFWSSQFNLDLADEWWNKSRISPLIATGQVWQEYTKTDPLFILDVPFRLWKSLREVVDVLGSTEDSSESVFRHKISSEIDSCVEFLFHKITTYLKKTKFEKHSPKDVEESLKNHLKLSVAELSEVVMSLNHEINKLSAEFKTPKPMSQAGFFWRDTNE